MALILASTGSTTANTYLLLARANEIAAGRLYVSAWTGATEAEQEAALIWATTLLDQLFEWYGTIRNLDQRLRWPRSGVYNRDGTKALDYDSVPALLEQGTFELALALLTRDLSALPDLLGLGFEEASVGPLRVKVSPKMVVQFIDQNIIDMLASLGECTQTRPSGGVVNLVRS